MAEDDIDDASIVQVTSLKMFFFLNQNQLKQFVYQDICNYGYIVWVLKGAIETESDLEKNTEHYHDLLMELQHAVNASQRDIQVFVRSLVADEGIILLKLVGLPSR